MHQRPEGVRPSGKSSGTKGIAISTSQISQLKVQATQMPNGSDPGVRARATTA
jgi:hypothetical protein